MRQVEIRLLGRFEVVVDSHPLPSEAWPQRRAADLVKVLALAPGHRMPRDELLESLWPRLGADAAAANLHKAASYARRALGARRAIVLRSGMVELAPDAEVTTDVERFERGDAAAYGGELLPDDPYASWALAARARLRQRRLDLLRERRQWEEVLREEPADEEAHRALMRRHLASGDRLAATRQLRLLRDELARLGVDPSAETLALAREVARGPAVRAARLLHAPLEGQERELAAGIAALRRAAGGHGGTLLVRGAMGSGKTRLVEAVLAEAEELGFHTLRGAAHEQEGRTPYAPLIEALDPLAARRPELAGALTDSAQAALARLLSSVPHAASAAQAVNRHRLFSAIAQLLAQAAAARGVVLAIDDLHAADEATAALLHHLARSAAGERLLVVAALRDEPLPKAIALVRSSLLERGAAVELALGPLGRAPLEAIAQRAAGRPLAPATLAAIERSAAGNPFFAEELAASVDAAGDVTVSPRLREIAGHRLERLEPLGEQLLAALAVIDDGFTGADLRALAGGEPVDRALATAVETGVLEAVRGRYRFRHALLKQELADRVPEQTTRPPRRSRTICCGPAAQTRPSRCSPRPPAGPRRWGPTATAPSGPSWRSSTRTSTSARNSSSCGRGPSTGRASPAPPSPTPRRSRPRPPSACPGCERSRRARAWLQATSPARAPRSKRCGPIARRTAASSSCCAAWSRGTRATGTARGG